MWMDIYDKVRNPIIMWGIGMFGIAAIMLVSDYIKGKDKKGSLTALGLVAALMVLAGSMI